MKVDFNFKNLFKIKIGKVYDVTEFAQSHPGGKANIMLAAGGDLGFDLIIWCLYWSTYILE